MVGARNGCRNRGITERAVGPTPVGSVGTSRQPRTDSRSSAASSAAICATRSAAPSSVGTNAMPVAYSPGAGNRTPATAR